MPVPRWTVAGIAALAFVLLVMLLGRQVLQARAHYPGDVVFIGEASGILAVEYERVAVWRAANDTSPLPDWTLHLSDGPHRLDELTEELVTGLGGGARQGGLRDSHGCTFSYRFENGRLTWFSLRARDWRFTDTPSGSDVQDKPLMLSRGDGDPIEMPVSQRDLVRACGRPDDVTWDLAN